MSAECQHCAGRAELFLCGPCTNQLRDLLTDLPWWIDRLEEAAIGQTRMSDGTRGASYGSRYPIHGEDNIAHYLATYPRDADDLPDDKARRARQEAAQRQALAAGRVNARAAGLLERVNNSLTTWVRHICETHGVEYPTKGRTNDR